MKSYHLQLMVDLEGIMLSEISQTEKIQIAYDFIYIWNLENKQNRNRLIDTENKLTGGRGVGGWVETVKGLNTRWYVRNSHRDVKCRLGGI